MRSARNLGLSIGLFLVFATAKIAATLLCVSDGTAVLKLQKGWLIPALFSDDARAVLAVLSIALLAQAVGRFLPRLQRIGEGLAWIIYAGLAIYAAINVPVTRTMGTPLTYSILRAAGGALSDSLRVYLTLKNVAAVLAVLAVATVAPLLASIFRRRASISLLFGCVIILAMLAALGPAARARVQLRGLARNSVVALALTTLAQREKALLTGQIPVLPIENSDAAEIDLLQLRNSARGHNVIWIVLESTAAQYLGIYGAARDPMPNLSALAAHGVVFHNAYAAYPESIKGLFSMLCSTYPAAHLPVERYRQEHQPCTSLAAVFADAGYRTAMFHSGWFAYLGMDGIVQQRGFDLLQDAGNIGGAYQRSFGVDEASTVNRLLDFIDDNQRRKQPFFVMYLPITGHHPYYSPGPETRPQPFGEASDQARYLNDLYLGDQSLGTLRAGITQRGLDENTVWVISGDHGEAFYQHPGNFAHTLFLYEENVHVPLILAAPNSPRFSAQQKTPRIASVIDIAPTILSWCGLPVPPRYQGRSLLENKSGVARFLIDHTMFQVGLRQGRWKYIHEIESGRSQLYDLTQDPTEQHNLSSQNPQRTNLYREHLRAVTALP